MPRYSLKVDIVAHKPVVVELEAGSEDEFLDKVDEMDPKKLFDGCADSATYSLSYCGDPTEQPDPHAPLGLDAPAVESSNSRQEKEHDV